MLRETVELGTDRVIRWGLTEDGQTVANNTVTRVQFKVAGLCFDSDTDAEITLTDNATVVELRLGGAAIAPGWHDGFLTAYDAQSTNGLPWIKSRIRFVPWDKCA